MIPVTDLEGMRVLITGASSGIGAAVAEVMASCGARLCLHYHSGAERTEALIDKIAAAGFERPCSVGGDVTADGAAGAIVGAAEGALGGLDCLINNAGAIFRTRLTDYDDTAYVKAMELNAHSVALLSAAAYPLLKQSDRASIINVGSIAGRNGGAAGSGVYAAAKAVVHSMTKSFAREYAADGIRVNAVAPGVIKTPFHDATDPAVLASLQATIPLGRLGTAEDCAWPFAFLASPQMSGYITGAIIDINGGQLMP